MTCRVAAGDQAGALRTFQSSWALLSLVSLAVVSILAGTVWWVPWRDWFKLTSVSDIQAAAVIFLLALFILLTQFNGVLESGLRCDGNFATGVLLSTGQRLSEAAIATFVGIVTKRLVLVALAYLVTRTVGTVLYIWLLRHKSPWLHVGVKHAHMKVIKDLAAPACGFIMFPVGQLISLQGFVIMIGAVKGPLFVAIFATIRTMTRANFQLTNSIARALWPELSLAFGAKDISLARALHRRAFQSALFLSVLSGSALLLVGPTFYKIWTRGKLQFDGHLFHILLAVSLANSCWYTSSVVPMSINAHQKIALGLFCASVASLALGSILITPFGLSGCAVALLLIDIVMIGFIMRTALRHVSDNQNEFLTAVLTTLPTGQLKRLIRSAAARVLVAVSMSSLV